MIDEATRAVQFRLWRAWLNARHAWLMGWKASDRTVQLLCSLIEKKIAADNVFQLVGLSVRSRKYHLVRNLLRTGLYVDLVKILESEDTPHLHNECFRWSWSFVLAGKYTEETCERHSDCDDIASRGKCFRLRHKVLRAGMAFVTGPRTFHRVAFAQRGTWVLFVRSHIDRQQRYIVGKDGELTMPSTEYFTFTSEWFRAHSRPT